MKTLVLRRVDERVEEIAKDPDAYVVKIRAEREQHGRPGAWLNEAPSTGMSPAQKRRFLRRSRAQRTRPTP